jgi:small subunit ribosomal protein S5
MPTRSPDTEYSGANRAPHNMVKATFDALRNISSPRTVAAKRGKKVGEIVGRRETNAEDRTEAA